MKNMNLTDMEMQILLLYRAGGGIGEKDGKLILNSVDGHRLMISDKGERVFRNALEGLQTKGLL